MVATTPTDRAAAAARGAGVDFPATPSGQPVALAGFGVTLALVSLVNLGVVAGGGGLIIAPAAFSLGFVGLVLAGMWDYRAGDMFSATWDVVYGTFWLFLGLWLTFFQPAVTSAAGADVAARAFGVYMFIWAVFTLCMSFGAYYVARPPFLAFVLLTLVFLLNGIGSLVPAGGGATFVQHLTGLVGLVDAAVALYVAFALVFNGMSKRDIVPLWPHPAPT